MMCPKCGCDCSVRDSRQPEGKPRYRRYRCDSCGNRFTTYEITEIDYKLLENMKERFKAC